MGIKPPSIGQLMKPAEVAALLRVPETTLAIWRCTGRVKLAYLKIGRAVRYQRSDVEQLAITNRHGDEAL